MARPSAVLAPATSIHFLHPSKGKTRSLPSQRLQWNLLASEWEVSSRSPDLRVNNCKPMPSRLLACSKLVSELLQHSPSEPSHTQHHASLSRRFRFRLELPLQVSEMISLSLILPFHKESCSLSFVSHSKSFCLSLSLQTVCLFSYMGLALNTLNLLFPFHHSHPDFYSSQQLA